ncbi:NADH-ubiquinone reductase complex 1 MLRQ subunit [Toxoplasma gondii TgCatPRC2]|uniref:NADH-ubiquinone reductase complex 1 MLRQ subunit n=14 Tax=Toxoplasma gondii TaxID=5811 RepID=A0A125YY22_TOXGV|nr:hypothetical protein TGME49_306670 [Toxoplasma gondii ME49]EPR57524.1 hypothetical protein TGGT1_306670 [Toxoplasma gondii GT1]ESS28961.1 NADH-ubiquinone reductase complex 1 MLRQ subunit [Toxoplasma gondii VEG]KAF4644818.1 hypothetical protein TGRH88_018120 [Toxoplasma gondii]KFG33639.1 NADH-ubiquinone reductase complex 1 MLRQ subunit [Toxoplasma gondii GAB2-2007-GAL-DOM2]KFG44779.1 NADH-ubiquinone reductase complex protein [Toxoplasma gondii FOU]KFG59391.1 NADH-ubiquinone reductase comple|eukprot:XP_018636185.1 hypothetical protein TGME49_306670 [Toxoplasma gondii ME49]
MHVHACSGYLGFSTFFTVPCVPFPIFPGLSHLTIILNSGKMNAAHLRAIFGNWCTRGTDHIVVDMYAKKFYKAYFADPVQYNYLFVSFFAVGCAATMCLRHLMLNPDICVRRGDARRHFIDRWQHHLYSLPYYNHYLRNFALRFQNSIVDNEPDYLGSHPWGVRPKRGLNYGRLPFTFMNPYRYFVDDPQYVNTLHDSMEKHYEALGYYPNRVTNAEEDE